MSLKDEITKLSHDFAQGVLNAIRTASLDEILGENRGAAPKAPKATKVSAVSSRRPAAAPAPAAPRARKAGRLHRRSEEELGVISDKIIDLLKARTEGLRAEQIRVELGLEAKELPRPLKDLLASRKIKAKG